MNTETSEYPRLTRWTHPANYCGEIWPNYYSFLGQSRDSSALERSNFVCGLAKIGGESETVRIVRENHWAVGWVEWIAIHQDDTTALTKADAIKAKLEDYPVVNEEHLSETEMQDANETWANCFNLTERVKYVRDHRSQFEFHDFADMLCCLRGQYFSGYASELIS